ncbi:MAG: hypothetical protein ACOVJ8_06710 [Sediminibacterium sp.]|jgi:hypothetical protein
MSQDLQQIETEKDINHNWVTSSKFILYVSIFAILSLVLGNCTKLFTSGFKKTTPEVQTSSQYKPEYK